MRLVHVTTVPMSLRFLAGQVSYMKRRGVHVQVLSSPGPALDRFGAREGVAVHGVEMSRRITPLRDLKALWGIYRVLRRIRPDIVHTHTPKGGLLGMIAAWLARCPVRVYHMRGLPFMTASGLRRTLLRWTERVACSRAHRVICVSRSLRAVAIAERLCSSAKIRVLRGGSGNGVDAGGRFDPGRVPADARWRMRHRHAIPRDAVVLGFVGRVVRDKGIAELAAAWRELRDECSGLHLLVVGPLEPDDPVSAETHAILREDPRIHLLGMQGETPPLYAAMDLVVLPTHREGFPNVPLEAAAMELPVVATRIPGCIDAVRDGETGLLVPPGDSAALARAIRTYLRDAGLRRAHGRAGRTRVLRDFRQDEIWRAVYREYDSLWHARGLGAADVVPAPGPSGVLSLLHRSGHGE